MTLNVGLHNPTNARAQTFMSDGVEWGSCHIGDKQLDGITIYTTPAVAHAMTYAFNAHEGRRTYADGIREAIALLTDWADEADGNLMDASTPFSADLYRRERDCHREAAEELAKRIAPATPALQAAE